MIRHGIGHVAPSATQNEGSELETTKIHIAYWVNSFSKGIQKLDPAMRDPCAFSNQRCRSALAMWQPARQGFAFLGFGWEGCPSINLKLTFIFGGPFGASRLPVGIASQRSCRRSFLAGVLLMILGLPRFQQKGSGFQLGSPHLLI